jgi:NitT/TauT family transport system substrate-binding protein
MARLLLIALLFGLAGPARAADTLRPFTLGIGGEAQIGYLPATLADRLGYYRDAGLDVSIVTFQGGTKAVAALVGGSLDAMCGAYDNAVILQEKGVFLTTIFTFVDHYGYVFGMPAARAAKYHSPKDLKGMAIGVTAPGSSTESLVRILIAKDGLDFNDIATVAVGTGPGAVSALVMGVIDGLVTGDPDATRMQIQGQFVPLVDTRTRAGMDYIYGGEAAGAGSLVMESAIKQHPDLVQAYVTALYRAQRWLVAASPEAIAANVPDRYWGGDKAVYEKALAATHQSFTADGRTTLAKAKVTRDGMVRAGRLPASAATDFGRSFDDDFVEHAKAAAPH